MVLAKGPWTVRGAHLALKDWRSDKTLDEIDFSFSTFWVQVHGLLAYKYTKENAEFIGNVDAYWISAEISRLTAISRNDGVQFFSCPEKEVGMEHHAPEESCGNSNTAQKLRVCLN